MLVLSLCTKSQYLLLQFGKKDLRIKPAHHFTRHRRKSGASFGPPAQQSWIPAFAEMTM
jgi:hypothetical protein